MQSKTKKRVLRLKGQKNKIFNLHIKKEVSDEHGCLVLSLLPPLKADSCLLESEFCAMLPPDNVAFGLLLALNHISSGIKKKIQNTLSNQSAAKISIN